MEQRLIAQESALDKLLKLHLNTMRDHVQNLKVNGCTVTGSNSAISLSPSLLNWNLLLNAYVK